MKALSIRQPWAELIVRGFKPVENRTWATRYRGPVLIHAGQTFDVEGMDWVRAHREALGLPEDWLTWTCNVGGIVGAATITDCVTRHDSPWFFGPRGLVLDDARMLPFLPRRGHLGLFEVEVAPSYAELATKVYR